MNKTIIVGIGASAGGLEATLQLVAALDPGLPCCYVLLQHMSPGHRSLLAEILSKDTRLEVRDAADGDALKAGSLLVVPANTNASLLDGKLRLEDSAQSPNPKPSVNQFFLSLAAQQGEHAVGIVLSGTGSDGTAGLRAIQAAGGLTFAQTPATAKYEGMPHSAIHAGVVDHVLSPEEIARALPDLLRTAEQVQVTPDHALLAVLLGRLKAQLGYDFSGYKPATLLRRIQRRMVVNGVTDLAAYQGIMETQPEEAGLLMRDILISVTAFFRDREAFDALQGVIEALVARKTAGEDIRIWVAGCASGEEAYSIAMLLAEALEKRKLPCRAQLFATDIDDEALTIARRGIYPAGAMSGVPTAYLERYFLPVQHSYEVSKRLRDMVTVAKHNLVSDPPFLRLDLVSCRNVLIYFDVPLQARVLRAFHFALERNGCLFLGHSESTSQAESLYEAHDRKQRLYRKVKASRITEVRVMERPQVSTGTLGPKRESLAEILLAALARHFDMTMVLCESGGLIRHAAGPVETLLRYVPGESTHSLFDAVPLDMRSELLTLFHRLKSTGKAQSGRLRQHAGRALRLDLEPLQVGNMIWVAALFRFESAAPAQPSALLPVGNPAELESELDATRDHLQAVIEELATANEETQALNEEAQAANEELQATNEELEASNEELHATNEELISLNEELNSKGQELALLASEFANLYDALPYPVLLFNRELHLTRYNAASAQRFGLRLGGSAQLGAGAHQFAELEGFAALLAGVAQQGQALQRTLMLRQRTLQLTVTPGIDADGQAQNLVVTLVDVSEIAAVRNDLANSQARLTALMEKTTIIFAIKDLLGVYQFANQRFQDYFALSQESILGRTDYQLFGESLASHLSALDIDAIRHNRLVMGTHRLESDGQTRHLRTTHQVLRDGQGNPHALLVEAEDITQQVHSDAQLRVTARVFEQAGEAIVITDIKGVIQSVNQAFTKITGYEAAEALGNKLSMLKSGRQDEAFYHAMWSSIHAEGRWQGEIWNRRKDGQIYPEWLSINRVENADGVDDCLIAVFSDITAIKNSYERAEYLATHDTLTGLPNRALFQDRLRHALAGARRSQEPVALLFIDLDNFKTVNDTLGHDFGDALLQQAAQRLTHIVRDVDTVARLGGDEFTALLEHCDSKEVSHIGQRIADEMSASFTIEDKAVFVSASIGIAFFPDDGENSVDLVKAADAAMYRAKELGRNRVEFFKPDLGVRLLKRATIERALRIALRQRQMRIVLQPKFGASDARPLVGAEALLRWTDGELGVVAPADFIAVAEHAGLVLEVQTLLEDLLFSQIGEWLRAGLSVPQVAFNVSPRSLREPGFSQRLLSRIRGYGLPGSMLQIEITENALVENSTQIAANLKAIGDAGLGISIDDFGTGYSSLAYIKRLPITEIKIDKTFVDGLTQDRESEAIAEAVLSLCQTLQLHSVAEGVENAQQFDWLQRSGCEMIQGYFCARPLEAADFARLLKPSA